MSIPRTGPVPTPEEVWRTLDRVAKRQAELDRWLQRWAEETDRRIEENERQTQRRAEETDRRIKENERRTRKAEDLFTTQWGRLVESLVRGDLKKLLQARGLQVDFVDGHIEMGHGPDEREIDLLAEGEADIVVVEVKTTLRPGDVNRFLELMKHPCLPRRARGRRLLGGVAYIHEHEGTVRYAERKGLFVIRATGSSASIVNPPDFRPRDFG